MSGIIASALSCAHLPPAPTEWVTDPGGYMTPGKAALLNGILRGFQERTKHHVLVWISDLALPPDEPIETFCSLAFNSWGIGRRGYNDGVVLFVFPAPPEDRLRMRIQVGYGLEAALPDAEAVRILREVIAPPAEAGHHDEAIEAGVLAILAHLGGHGQP